MNMNELVCIEKMPPPVKEWNEFDSLEDLIQDRMDRIRYKPMRDDVIKSICYDFFYWMRKQNYPEYFFSLNCYIGSLDIKPKEVITKDEFIKIEQQDGIYSCTYTYIGKEPSFFLEIINDGDCRIRFYRE